MTQITDLIKSNARLSVLLAVIVALVAANLVFYLGSQSSTDEQATVEKQLTNARLNLAIAQNKYDLQKLQTELVSLEGTPTFPASFPNVELSDYITAGATDYRITVVSLTPKGKVGTKSVGGTDYAEYDTSVQISGDYRAVDSFLSYLEDGYLENESFISLSIEKASFTASGGTFTVVILAKS